MIKLKLTIIVKAYIGIYNNIEIRYTANENVDNMFEKYQRFNYIETNFLIYCV